MDIDGRCHCGAIAFEGEADPAQTTICHCTDCQAITGSAFRINIRVAGKDFRLTRGEPARYLKTTSDSGNKRVQAFCPNCGTQLFASAPGDDPPAYTVRVGTLRQREQLSPTAQQWWRSAQGWVTGLAGLPRHDKGAA
jgi:hypothetical protein